MKNLLFILIAIVSFSFLTPDDPPHIPPTVKLQTPNNPAWWWEADSTRLHLYMGTYGWLTLTDSAEVWNKFFPYRNAKDTAITTWPIISTKLVGDTAQINNVLVWGNDTILKDSLVYVDVKPDSIRLRYIDGTYSKWYWTAESSINYADSKISNDAYSLLWQPNDSTGASKQAIFNKISTMEAIDYCPDTLIVNTGTLDQGDASDLCAVGGTDVIISESSGADPLRVTFEFSGVSRMNYFVFFGDYDGGASHVLWVEAYNWTTLAWDYLGLLGNSNVKQWYSFPIFTPNTYISSGAVQIRISHQGTGIISHQLVLDYVDINFGGAGGGTSIEASTVGFTPAGGVSSTNVQAAIQELDTEKQNAANAVTATSAFGTDNRLIKSNGTGRDTEVTGLIVDSNNKLGIDVTPLAELHLDGIYRQERTGSPAQYATLTLDNGFTEWDSNANGGYKWLFGAAQKAALSADGDLTLARFLKLSASSDQVVFQSGGVTGTITWTPASTNKTMTIPNRTFTADNITTSTTTTGTGFVKGNGSVISFDNSTYLKNTDLSGIRDTLALHADSLKLAFDSLSVHLDTLQSHNLRLIAVEGLDTTGIYHANRNVLNGISASDTARYNNAYLHSVADADLSVTNELDNATHTGDATGSGALTVVALNGTNLAALSTGLIKNTTGTGVPTIITDNSTNWDKYNQWDGGSTGLVAATGRSSLGLVIGTDVLAYRTFGTAANSATTDFEVPLTFSTGLNRTGNTITSTITQFTTGDEIDPKYAADSAYVKTGMRNWYGSLAYDIDATDTTYWGAKQKAYTNLSSIGSLANTAGYVKNNGSGGFSYTFPTFSEITSKPTTLSGYGITDAVQLSPASQQAGSINISSTGTFGSTIQATTGKFTNLTDGYIPYHVSDATGLANSGFYWDAVNLRVGIGTTGPGSALHIATSQATKTTIGSSNQLILANTNGGVGERLEIGMGYKAAATNQPVTIGHIVTSNSAYTKGDFYIATRDVTTDTAPTERLYIQSSGNVGIGTTTGINSKLTFAEATTAAGGILFGSDVNLYRSAANVLKTDDTFNIATLTASKVVFTDASKNLTSTGIGTSSQFIMGDGSLNSATYLTSSTGVTTFSGGTTGLTPSSATSGAITLAGTLGYANGGTGLTTLGTASQMLRVNSGATALEYWAPNFLTSEVDGSTTNEIQDLSLTGNTLSLSGDATTVDLSGYVNPDLSGYRLISDTVVYKGTASNYDLITGLALKQNAANAVTATSAFNADNRLIKSNGTGRDTEVTGLIVDSSDNITGAKNITSTDGQISYTKSADTAIEGTSTSSTGVRGNSTTGNGGVFISNGTNAPVLSSVSATDGNTAKRGLLIRRFNSTGAGANDIGTSIDFQLEDDGGNPDNEASKIETTLTSAASGAETSKLSLWTRYNGSALAENFIFDGQGNQTNTGSITLNTLNASQLVATDANKKLQSLAVATYPSLTEISYIKGLSSAAQTQINGKEPILTKGTLTEAVDGLVLSDSTRQVIGGATALSLKAGRVIPTSTNISHAETAYTDRLKWDGGSTGLVAATGRTSLGGTTLGQAMFTLSNPSAVTFPRFNADNTVTALSASDFRTAIGAGTGSSNWTVKGSDLYRLPKVGIGDFTSATIDASFHVLGGQSIFSNLNAGGNPVKIIGNADASYMIDIRDGSGNQKGYWQGDGTLTSVKDIQSIGGDFYTNGGIHLETYNGSVGAGSLQYSSGLQVHDGGSWKTVLTANQSITLSGDVSGTGATSITTAIGSGKVTAAMLKATNSPTNGYFPAYDLATGGITWTAGGSGTPGGSSGSIQVNDGSGGFAGYHALTSSLMTITGDVLAQSTTGGEFYTKDTDQGGTSDQWIFGNAGADGYIGYSGTGGFVKLAELKTTGINMVGDLHITDDFISDNGVDNYFEIRNVGEGITDIYAGSSSPGDLTISINSSTPLVTFYPKVNLTGMGTSIGYSTTGSNTMNLTTHTIIIQAGSTSATITLPTAVGVTGQEYRIVNHTAGARAISTYKDFAGSDATTIPANSSITVQAYDSVWYRVQ